jgi:7-cyano-7-deazaguanine reductase
MMAKKRETAKGAKGRIARAHAAARRRTPRRAAVETFPNPSPERDYEIDIRTEEWTALCPITGQPDFATIHITYVPDRRCLELKSLKLYLHSFRNCGVFHEAVTNEILDHLLKSCRPRRMRVVGDFGVRGGLSTVVTAEHPGAGPLSPPEPGDGGNR